MIWDAIFIIYKYSHIFASISAQCLLFHCSVICLCITVTLWIMEAVYILKFGNDHSPSLHLLFRHFPGYSCLLFHRTWGVNSFSKLVFSRNFRIELEYFLIKYSFRRNWLIFHNLDSVPSIPFRVFWYFLCIILALFFKTCSLTVL